jgi:2-polyprenyl-3-methyl-5-hydroxy-6-metoxy-1,4-benzoquinol methylase
MNAEMKSNNEQNQDLVLYYAERAKEYEKIYYKPERQEDLEHAGEILKKLFSGLEVLEVAAGTGYWTEKISATAKSIDATDINRDVIDIAKQKKYACPVKLSVQDLYQFSITKKYESLFAGFIWSHIKLNELDHFIDSLNACVFNGGMVVIMDNNFVDGSSTAIAETDKDGNTFQHRTLADGSRHRVLKNFPDEQFLRKKLQTKTKNLHVITLKYFWILSYQVGQ